LRELCESIYRQHRQAIDILHDNRPDPFSRVFTIVESLVKESGFTPAESDNVAVRFIPQEFTIPLFKSDTAWLDERQMVYAECKKKAKTQVFQVKMDGRSMEERSLAHQFALTHNHSGQRGPCTPNIRSSTHVPSWKMWTWKLQTRFWNND